MSPLLLSLCVMAAFFAQSQGQGCTSDYCLNGGVCIVVAGAPACACPAGFSGTNCQTSDGGVSTNACDSAPCLNGGTCQPVDDQFKCICTADWLGPVCQTSAIITTPDPGFACPAPVSTLTSHPGCNPPAEVIFMIEYAEGDSRMDVDHEGDFIKELINQWDVSSTGIRIGIVTYHDTVSEAIHIDDFENDPAGLMDRITRLTRRLRPSGQNDLANALDYVYTTSFAGARPGAEKVIIPIVHMMPENATAESLIIDAANRVKSDCITVIGLGVLNSGRTNTVVDPDDVVERAVMERVVSVPAADHYMEYNDFIALENSATQWGTANCN